MLRIVSGALLFFSGLGFGRLFATTNTPDNFMGTLCALMATAGVAITIYDYIENTN